MSDSSEPTGDDGFTVYRDRSFWGLTISQFLGAFNDNLFKQLVLLLCVDFALDEFVREGAATNSQPSDSYQPIAMAVFAIPWILFSGIAGWLSDRTSKQRGVLIFKSLEILVMFCGMAAFLTGHLSPLFLVLFLMSAQSTFFGPCKYGILPELFPEHELPRVNGVIQMSTFVAIIFGMASAGFVREIFPGQKGLAVISGISVVIAVAGVAAARLIRPVEIARPQLPFTWSSLGIGVENWQLLRSDRFLSGVLLISSLFWFSGGVVQQAINAFGKRELGLGDGRTSLMAACLGVGIACGCLLAGRYSRERIRFSMVSVGAWGMALTLGALTALSYLFDLESVAAVETSKAAETIPRMLMTASPIEWTGRLILIGLGASAGLFVVPLQVVLQAVPPESQKGRVIGTMNLANWIGILLSAVYYGCFEMLRGIARDTADIEIRPSMVFLSLAVILALVGVFYRPADRELE